MQATIDGPKKVARFDSSRRPPIRMRSRPKQSSCPAEAGDGQLPFRHRSLRKGLKLKQKISPAVVASATAASGSRM